MNLKQNKQTYIYIMKRNIKNGKAKNVEVNTKSDGSIKPVKETKVTYKLKK